jgi:hypothetical protein
MFAISYSLIFACPTVHHVYFYDSENIISPITMWLLLYQEPEGVCYCSDRRRAYARRCRMAERGVYSCGGVAERVVPRCGSAM